MRVQIAKWVCLKYPSDRNDVMKIATWNLNTSFTGRNTRAAQWDWITRRLETDFVVLTEAEVPEEGLPKGWNAYFKAGGIGPTRRWGTIIAAREELEIRDITDGVEGKGGFILNHTRPGTVVVVDILRKKKVVATVVGIYAMTTSLDGKKLGTGWESIHEILSDLQPLFESKRAKRLIMTGDLNLLPNDIPQGIYDKCFDAVLETEKSRQKPGYCCVCSDDQMCGHMWTHWNRAAPERVQNIDYMFISKKLYIRMGLVTGGRIDYPDAEGFSDHAPVVMDITL